MDEEPQSGQNQMMRGSQQSQMQNQMQNHMMIRSSLVEENEEIIRPRIPRIPSNTRDEEAAEDRELREAIELSLQESQKNVLKPKEAKKNGKKYRYE